MRTVNLKYNQDDNGSTKLKGGPGFRDLMLKISRSDNNYRSMAFWVGIASISILTTVMKGFSREEDPAVRRKREAEELGRLDGLIKKRK